MKFLYLFVIPYFLFITTLSLLSRAFANWGAPVYVAGIILVIAYLIKQNRLKVVKISLGVNILLALILYFYHPIISTFGVELSKKNDPYNRINGWEKVAKEFDNVRVSNNYRMIFEDRKIMSEMIYYMNPHPFDSMIFNPSQNVSNQYDMFNSMSKPLEGKFIFVTDNKETTFLNKNFEKVELLKEVNVQLYKNYGRNYKLFLVENFKGFN